MTAIAAAEGGLEGAGSRGKVPGTREARGVDVAAADGDVSGPFDLAASETGRVDERPRGIELRDEGIGRDRRGSTHAGLEGMDDRKIMGLCIPDDDDS